MARLPKFHQRLTRPRSFRLSEREDDQLGRTLKHSGLSLSDLIRKKVLNDNVGAPTKRATNITPQDYLSLLSRLQTVGHAIEKISENTSNQMAIGQISADNGQLILEKLAAVWELLKGG